MIYGNNTRRGCRPIRRYTCVTLLADQTAWRTGAVGRSGKHHLNSQTLCHSGNVTWRAFSPEAHKTLNVAMNRIGAKSDSGEGGEDPAHFHPEPNGDNPSAKIKQVASGRFGVTAEYLNQCEELGN